MSITGSEAGALERAATLTLAAREDLGEVTRSLTSRVSLGGAQWDGDGARAFQTAYAQWADQQRQVVEALQWFHDQLRAIDLLNSTTDAELARSFGVGS